MVALLPRLSAFVRLGRPIFLGRGVVLYGLGAAMAVYAGARLSLPLFAGGLFAITATQLMTHYGNEYFDLEADRAERVHFVLEPNRPGRIDHVAEFEHVVRMQMRDEDIAQAR